MMPALFINGANIRFQMGWMSPCFWEEASIALQLGFAGYLLYCYIIKKNVDFSNTGRTASYVQQYYGLSYKLVIICSILMLSMDFLALIFQQSDTGNRCHSKVILSSSRFMQVVSWAITLSAMYRIKNRNHLKFPWILRFWWISSFLLSLARAMIDIWYVAIHGNLITLEYGDVVSLLASTCLFSISVQGNTGIASSCLSNDTSEPLLNESNENHIGKKRHCLYGKASLVQLLTFSWLNPLFEVGYKRPIDQDDVPDIDLEDSASFVSQDFDECLKYMKDRGSNGALSLYMTICFFARKKAAANALFAIINAVASYVGPYLIKDFVKFLNRKKYNGIDGYLLVFGFFAAKVVEIIAETQLMVGSRQLELRLRSAMISQIYKKGLNLPCQSSCTSGEIMNYVSVDLQRIIDFMWYLNLLCMLPIQISLAIYILHINLGVGAFIALAATFMVMACNFPLTRMQKGYQKKIMKAKDDRMKSTTEVLRNMRTIKLQAWDSFYLGKILGLRNVEHNHLWESLRLTSLTTFIFWASPAFISVVTFGGCVLIGIPLTAGRVLSSLATFQVLQTPILNLPDLLNVFAQGKVSGDRVSSFLHEDEIKLDAVENVPTMQTEFHVEIDGGNFSWETESICQQTTLDQINLQVRKRMKIAICGTVGSGKSSLLSCILGEMNKLSGTVKISGTKAYVPQTPWILSGTIRDNILFGNPYEQEKYSRIIGACALNKDLELFAAGDLTEIGERGINMSGGQKQRIQIARALYQDADIYLLDDPFSAVDAHTGTQLFQDCLMGILKDKTTLYVTHQVEFLPAADLILVMQNGKIAQAGSFKELLQQNIGFEVLVGAHNQALESVLTVESSSRTSENTSVDNETETDNNRNPGVEITGKQGKLVQDEERKRGSIGKEIYMSYLTTAKGGVLVLFILLAQAFFQALQIGSNYWMAWACPAGDDMPMAGMHYVLLVYTLLSIGSSVCVLIRASLVSVAGLLTAEKMFNDMLNSVFRAPMAFFDSTPTGRILSRASADQSTLDLNLARRLGSCAFRAIQLLGTLAVMSQVAWQVLIVFVPVAIICIWYQKQYIPTARELPRLSGIQRAPILHHFGETLAGAQTVRAFGQKDRFTNTNLCLIDNYARPWFHFAASNEWLSFRLNQLSNVVFAFSLVLLVTLPEGTINPSIAGLAVTYGINLNALQASLLWCICNTENKMISVERILQYSNLTSESPLVIDNTRPTTDWPHSGTICFRNLQIRYAEHLPLILKDITCTFPGRKKIGVVGRTGSGKSTLVQAIFRLVEPGEGSIFIDDVDISKIGLHDLRSKLSIIPQDPTMFEGTVRRNLDPLDQYSEMEIWEALDKCQLGSNIRGKPQKLESPVVENGENWSAGQRQLFCLGRALLKKSSILFLDEATASIDSATDCAIQKIINEEFKERTVVTIAHRIHTVVDSDLVLVLSDGRVGEYDTPSELMKRGDSLFSKLIKEYAKRSKSFNSMPK